MKVYILNLGTMELDANVMLRFATRARKSDPAAPAKWIQIPVWAALIDTGDHKILFDLGCREDAMEGGWPPSLQDSMPIFRKEDEYMEPQLQKIGLTPKDIDIVVLSHLHADHYGTIDKFSHCDVYLPREEWVNALIKTHETADPFHGGTYIKSCIEAPVRRYHPIEIGDDFELLPGIEIVTLPGHAPNVLGMVVHLEKDGVLIFPSDAISMQETYDSNVIGGIPYDGVAYEKSVEKVRRLERKYGGKVMISHSFQLFHTLKRLPEYYE